MKTIAIVGGGSGGLGTANRLAYKFTNEIKAGNIKIILYGLRRMGKTTIMYQIISMHLKHH